MMTTAAIFICTAPTMVPPLHHAKESDSEVLNNATSTYLGCHILSLGFMRMLNDHTRLTRHVLNTGLDLTCVAAAPNYGRQECPIIECRART